MRRRRIAVTERVGSSRRSSPGALAGAPVVQCRCQALEPGAPGGCRMGTGARLVGCQLDSAPVMVGIPWTVVMEAVGERTLNACFHPRSAMLSSSPVGNFSDRRLWLM